MMTQNNEKEEFPILIVDDETDNTDESIRVHAGWGPGVPLKAV